MKETLLLALSIYSYSAPVSANKLPFVETGECFSTSESMNLSTREYYNRFVRHRGDHQHHLLDKHKDERKNDSNLQTVFDKIKNGSSSKHEWKQWQSMFRTLFISGLTVDDLPDTLCFFASSINHTIEIENGDQNKEKFICAFDETFYTQIELFYRIVKNILTEKGCSTSGVPTAVIPKCYDPSRCVDGGVNFMFGEIWQKVNGTMDFLGEDADHAEAEEMYSILKPVYDAGDLYGKYVVAITTTFAMEFNWIVKAKQYISPEFLEFAKASSLIEESIESPPECDCEDLQKILLQRIRDFDTTVWLLIEKVKNSHNLIYSQGHVEHLKKKHSKNQH